MVGRFPHGLTAGMMAGTTIALLAVLAHVSAGGQLGGIGSFAAMVGAIAFAAVLGTRLRWTFPRILLAASAVQPLLHVVFTAGHAGESVHGAHAHHMTNAATARHPSMAIVHIAVALVSAVVVRWGSRWLRSMPELVRAIVFATPRLALVPPAPTTALTPASALAGGRQATQTWTCRGPPG